MPATSGSHYFGHATSIDPTRENPAPAGASGTLEIFKAKVAVAASLERPRYWQLLIAAADGDSLHSSELPASMLRARDIDESEEQGCRSVSMISVEEPDDLDW